MGIKTDYRDEEIHYNSLFNFVQRGKLFAALTNDGQSVYVNGGTSHGYPSGYSVLQIDKKQIPELIAVLTASMQLKE